jgi:hypothetical protein
MLLLFLLTLTFSRPAVAEPVDNASLPVAGSSQSVSQAQDQMAQTQPSTSQSQPSSVQPATGSGNSPATTTANTKVSMPTRLAGCIAGTMVGIPVCVVRRSKFEDWYAAHNMVGDDGNKALRVTLKALWCPVAVITGVCEAPADGTMNAIRNSSKPFSKDQFSLGVLKQNQE